MNLDFEYWILILRLKLDLLLRWIFLLSPGGLSLEGLVDLLDEYRLVIVM